MRNVIGILLAMMTMGILSGCYSTSCPQPPLLTTPAATPAAAPMNAKGES